MNRKHSELAHEIERAHFELGRCQDYELARMWQKRRERAIEELGNLASDGIANTELIRLVRAVDRGRELKQRLAAERDRLRMEAENLYAVQLLLKTLRSERRGSVVSLHV